MSSTNIVWRISLSELTLINGGFQYEAAIIFYSTWRYLYHIDDNPIYHNREFTPWLQ